MQITLKSNLVWEKNGLDVEIWSHNTASTAMLGYSSEGRKSGDFVGKMNWKGCEIHRRKMVQKFILGKIMILT